MLCPKILLEMSNINAMMKRLSSLVNRAFKMQH